MRRLALVIPPNPEVWQILETEDENFANPGDVWHDITNQPEVALGWRLLDGVFTSPPPPEPLPPQPPLPTLAELKAQLDAIAAQLALLEVN